ncbi:hypothetical protein [Virgibacillus phage Mimir87]|nr:hypothetical protein [Virgibacillus phage Mimir87]
MTEIIVDDGLEYTASNGRIRYNPEFHENHGKKWTDDDLAYMCSSWDGMKKEDIAMALVRTHGTVLSKVYQLKTSGRFEHYKKQGDSL